MSTVIKDPSYWILLLLLSLLITLIFPYSNDYAEYHRIYSEISGLGIVGTLGSGRPEFTYYTVNFLFRTVNLDFTAFVFVLSVFSLWVKSTFIYYSLRNTDIKICLISYFLILGLVIDAINIKAGMATSLFLVSLFFYQQSRFLLFILLSVLSLGAHPTIIFLYLLLFIYLLTTYFRLNLYVSLFYFIWLIFPLVLLFLFTENIFLLHFIPTRYGYYLSDDYQGSKNSSGLFYFYIYLKSMAILMLLSIYKDDQEFWPFLFILVAGFFFLLLLCNFPAIFSRLDNQLDLFLLPLMIGLLNSEFFRYKFFSILYLASISMVTFLVRWSELLNNIGF